jgi:lactoylglutathione lyase
MQGSRIFTVSTNGQIPPAFSMVDLASQYGMKTATVLEAEIETKEPVIHLDFMRNVENPLVCGIEIIDLGGGDRSFKKSEDTPPKPTTAPQTPATAPSTPPPAIKGFNHIAMAVKDLEESARFYREVIGLTQIEVPENLRSRYIWFRLAAGQELHLLLGRAAGVSNQDVNGSHLALTVEDANAVEKYFKEKNIPYRRHSRFDGAAQIYINDPDGYMIEFNEPKR